MLNIDTRTADKKWPIPLFVEQLHFEQFTPTHEEYYYSYCKSKLVKKFLQIFDVCLASLSVHPTLLEHAVVDDQGSASWKAGHFVALKNGRRSWCCQLKAYMIPLKNILKWVSCLLSLCYICLAQIWFVIIAPKQVMKPKVYIAALVMLILIIRSWTDRDLF